MSAARIRASAGGDCAENRNRLQARGAVGWILINRRNDAVLSNTERQETASILAVGNSGAAAPMVPFDAFAPVVFVVPGSDVNTIAAVVEKRIAANREEEPA